MLVESGLASSHYELIERRSGGSPKQFDAYDGIGYTYIKGDSSKNEKRSADEVALGVFG
jgi:hypothetical protein